jgi:hypothetical protein
MTTDAETIEIRGFWGGLDLPGLIDVHTHFMPERVLRKIWDYFDGDGPLIGGLKWPITYRKQETAVAQIRRTALTDDGQPVEPSGDLTGGFSEMAMYVLVRRGGTWWLAAGQNTPVLPPPGL